MPDTAATFADPARAQDLQDQLAAAQADFKRIGHEGYLLRSKIVELIEAYAEQYGCDASSQIAIIEERLESLKLDAQGPAWRKWQRICTEIEKLEDLTEEAA